MGEPLFDVPADARDTTRLGQFLAEVEAQHGLTLPDYAAAHAWSIDAMAGFWSAVWSFCGVVGDPGSVVVADADDMRGARFFPEATLNFAENLLRRNDESDALVFWCEDQHQARVSWRELTAEVSVTAQALRDAGVGPGDRVAAFLPNAPEAVIAMLAATSLGATWASCSPDFGESAVLDRFGQIEPTVLFACDGYVYAGKDIDVLPKLAAIVDHGGY